MKLLQPQVPETQKITLEEPEQKSASAQVLFTNFKVREIRSILQKCQSRRESKVDQAIKMLSLEQDKFDNLAREFTRLKKVNYYYT
jgi:hypothetical protein